MAYKARQGDIIWVDFEPQAGHEQKGRRPAIVVSNNTFNNFARVAAMICPITSTDKGIPIQVPLDNTTKTSGTIMCDQAKILDLQERQAEFIEKAPNSIVFEVIDIISSFIESEE
jgi:mRNA interferase MazF